MEGTDQPLCRLERIPARSQAASHTVTSLIHVWLRSSPGKVLEKALTILIVCVRAWRHAKLKRRARRDDHRLPPVRSLGFGHAHQLLGRVVDDVVNSETRWASRADELDSREVGVPLTVEQAAALEEK